MSASVQIAAAGTLLPAGVSPARADDLVPLFTLALGTLGRVVFAFGVCASTLSGMIGTTAGYALIASIPKVLINVRLGDYATVSTRPCGCPFSDLGMQTHLHGIASYEKLTSAGMHFSPHTLLRVLEQVLPQQFGGDPAHYQFVEADKDHLPQVYLRVDPSLGPIQEDRLIETVLTALGQSSDADAMMAAIWRQGGTLRVERRAPEATAAGKILALTTRSRANP